ncbi:MAG TPA: GAF domain-containing protein [candidate division Zixibacteria bacterium]|nr:GAF domain-containing protein [candidate division Zixibacteria bacterium]
MEQKRIQLIENVRKAIADKNTETEVLQAAIELIDGYSEQFDWSGFYMLRGKSLEIGPYIGPPTPHTKIELNAGICGAAASQKQSIVVDDVKADSRFLACSITTRSEIVVPLMDGDRVLGEIDIDSNTPSFFTDDDRAMFEQVAAAVVQRLKALG